MKFPIIPNSKTWLTISAVMVVLAVIAIAIFGLKVSIDFTGGTQMELKFNNTVPATAEIKEAFDGAVGNEKGERIISSFDNKGYLITSRQLTQADVEAFASAITAKGWDGSIVRTTTIGPSVGEAFKNRAYIAIALANLLIIVYLAIAFRRVPEGLSSWKFGLIAVVALIHDITIVVGIFALLGVFYGVEIDTLFITALLTILGFSVHDTIVVFDRVRENLKGEKGRRNLATIAEFALWQTMRRSINTSMSVLIVIVAMLFFFVGFPSLFAFFLALFAGITIGTYSSIFIASPLLVAWHKDPHTA